MNKHIDTQEPNMNYKHNPGIKNHKYCKPKNKYRKGKEKRKKQKKGENDERKEENPNLTT